MLCRNRRILHTGFLVVYRHNSSLSKDHLQILKKMISQNNIEMKERTRANYEAKKLKKMAHCHGNRNFGIEVIGSGGYSQPKTVNLYTDIFRGFFNCGEGAQRLANEYKLKMGKMPHVFVTYPSWENVSGILSMALSLQAVGIPELIIHGCKFLENIFMATNKFVSLRKLKVIVMDCLEHPEYEDGSINIKYIPLYSSKKAEDDQNKKSPSFTNDEQKKNNFEIDEEDIDYYAHLNGKKRKDLKQDSSQSDKRVKKFKMDDFVAGEKFAVAYICQTKPTFGTLNIEKCFDLGVPCGPALQTLKSGGTIKLENGREVRGCDVKSPDIPGGVVLVLEIPSRDYLSSLLNEKSFVKHQSGNPEDIASVVVHFSSLEIMALPEYKEWMNRFPSSTKHVLVNEGNRSSGSIGVFKHQEKLHMIHPEIFPLLRGLDIPEYPRCDDETVPEGHSVVFVDSEKDDSMEKAVANTPFTVHIDNSHSIEYKNLLDKVYFKCDTNSVIRGQTLCHLPVRPIMSYDYSNSLVAKRRYVQEQTLAGEGIQSELEELRREIESTELTGNEYPKILFLGTGSSMPSTLRNASGIILFTTEKNSIILDCGEGTFSQLYQFFGREKAQEVLTHLDAIYVSHMHSDHHMGLVALLKERFLSFKQHQIEYKPLILFAPIHLTRLLDTYNRVFENISHTYTFVPNSYLVSNDNHFYPGIRRHIDELNMKDIKTTLVDHCPHAFGVAFTHNDGWKLTYSGDTRPCDSLVKLGKNSDLLIHEATLDETLAGAAYLKLHSTSRQAIKIGERMNAKFTLLTHFSQRYSHIPIFDDNFTSKVGVAFDNMIVSLRQLPLLPKFTKALRALYQKNCDEMEEKVKKTLIKQKREKNEKIIDMEIRNNKSPKRVQLPNS